jgi:hypothetical protein
VPCLVGRPVRLVDHDQLGDVGRTDLGQHLVHRGHLGLRVRRRAVDHVHDQVGQVHRVEGGAERFDQLVGQLAHESHRVGDQHGLTAGELQLTGARVEGHEEPVLGGDAGIGELVEERRLAGVGVPHQRQLAVAAAGAALALHGSGPLHLAQVGLEPVHAPDQPAPVHLELGLSGPAGADATRLLAERRPAPAQPGQPVAQDGQLDLCLAFGAAGVLGEDVEDDGSAVDRRPPEELLEVAMLGRAQLVVEDDGVGIEAAAQRGDLLRLALADEGGRVGRIATLHDTTDDIGAGAVD